MTDKELQLKKTARRRLVGAVTLVILMLVILPFVLKDRVAELAQNDVKITVINQSQSEPMLQLPDEALAAELPVDPPSIQPSANHEATSDSTAEKSAQEAAQSLAEVVAQPSDKLPSQPAVAPPQAKKLADLKPDHAVTESKPAATSPVAEKKAVEKTAVAAEKPVPALAAAKFFVQLGVFSDPRNLESLRTKLKQAGFNAVSEPVDAANSRLRLRSSIFHDRDTALAELKKLQAAGFSGMVTGKP